MAEKTVNVVLKKVKIFDDIIERNFDLTSSHPRIAIGRASSRSEDRGVPSRTNALFNSPVISRKHAELTFEASSQTLLIRDTGSLHGTIVNGERLRPYHLKPLLDGAIVTIGSNVAQTNLTYTPKTFQVHLKFSETQSTSPVTMSTAQAMPIVDLSDETGGTSGHHIVVNDYTDPRPTYQVPDDDLSDYDSDYSGSGSSVFDQVDANVSSPQDRRHSSPGSSPHNPLALDEDVITNNNKGYPHIAEELLDNYEQTRNFEHLVSVAAVDAHVHDAAAAQVQVSVEAHPEIVSDFDKPPLSPQENPVSFDERDLDEDEDLIADEFGDCWHTEYGLNTEKELSPDADSMVQVIVPQKAASQDDNHLDDEVIAETTYEVYETSPDLQAAQDACDFDFNPSTENEMLADPEDITIDKTPTSTKRAREEEYLEAPKTFTCDAEDVVAAPVAKRPKLQGRSVLTAAADLPRRRRAQTGFRASTAKAFALGALTGCVGLFGALAFLPDSAFSLLA